VAGLDLLLITIYLICITLVFVQMGASLFVEQVEIIFNADDFRQQLEAQLLQEVIQIEFKLEPRYDRDALPSNVEITIQNISHHRWIYVEWDYSCVIDVDGQAKRLVRVPPGSTFDLLPSQMFTVLSPGSRFKEILTSEAALKRASETGSLEIQSALINLSKLNKDKKKKYVRLEKLLKNPATFYIRLVVRIGDKAKDTPANRLCVFNGGFTIKKVHWQQQLPWNLPKKK
jgi:hypothetical protein